MVSYINQLQDFQSTYQKLSANQSKRELKKNYPAHFKTNKKIQTCLKKNMHSLNQWCCGTPGNFVWVRKSIHKLTSSLSFLKPVLKFFNISDEKLRPRESAQEIYKFSQTSDSEEIKVKKKARRLNTLAKTLLIAGGIFAGFGILFPLAVAPLLLLASPITSLGVIAVSTVIGTVGVCFITLYPILKNSKAIKQDRFYSDPDFKLFLEKFLQKPKPIGLDYYLNEEDLTDRQLHKIYLNWKQEMKSAFSQEMIKKIETEASALGT